MCTGWPVKTGQSQVDFHALTRDYQMAPHFFGLACIFLGWPVKTPFFRSTCPYSRVGRYDFIKYEDPDFDEPDGCPDPEGWDAPDSEKPSFKIGCIMLVFRVALNPKEPKVGRDFVLVREMALADRRPDGPFPRLASEEPAKPPAAQGAGGVGQSADDYKWDDPEAKNKLGRLWTWAKIGTEPVFAVKAAKDIKETACLMPRWKGETAEWDVEHGVYENRTMMDARRRPPFKEKCDCGLE